MELHPLLDVMDAVYSKLDKTAKMLPLEFKSIKNFPNTLLNVVVRSVILNGRFQIHAAGLKINDSRSGLHQKADTATK